MLAAILLATTLWSDAPAAEPADLSFLEGNWTIHSAGGDGLGHARIAIPLDGAMIEERRVIADRDPQLLWMARLEHQDGWTQLFLSPGGNREFPRLSPQGQWPMVFGGDVTLANGNEARFRLTVDRKSDDEHHRLLEMSSDEGSSWRPVLDYHYRRAAATDQ
ncbi:hypothetical protein [Sphingomicrobium lutaoense]|uniref:DUF1579 domain-containing protein n=1 Tax=Sphingomicrobium lutaoense TaxID=515949 RepID=A0A839YX12_9SPHN|nr:hypothetical protein [Sphingomicrobium lutaoense]MBB3764741.1 hypothetical protein [Sphingomicrobium lutaoense]